MAKLKALPAQAIIDGFKGVIDYYMNYQACDRSIAGDGIPCARMWPRSPGHNRAPAVQQQWSAFAWASSNWNSIDPYVQEAYRQTAQESVLTSRDLFTKSFITDYFRDGQWTPAPSPNPPNLEESVMLPGCCAYLSASQLNLPHGANTKILFDQVAFDTGPDFNCVTSRYVAPRDGRYLAIATLFWWNMVADKTYRTHIFVNGARVRATSPDTTKSDYFSCPGFGLLNLSLGDEVEVYGESIGGVDTVDIFSDNSPTWTRFEIALVE